MGPPPTPQQVHQAAQIQSTAPPPSTRRNNASLPVNNRFLPPSQRFAPPVPVDQQRFMPSVSNGAPQRFAAEGVSGSRALAHTASSRAPSRATMPVPNMSSQRVPFVPRAPGGFG
jgi:hypothetical protein